MALEVNKDALQKLLDSGNAQKCLKFFHAMPEKTRREYFAVVKQFSNQVRKKQFIEDPPGTFRWNPLANVAQTAFFAVASGAEIKKAKRWGYPDDELAFAILTDRKPEWIDDWIESLLGESYYWNHWQLIRRLIVAGLAKKPQSPRYYLGMISGLNGRMNKRSLVDDLQDAPDLLKDDIWKLFEYDGDGENSLANTERFECSWIDAFLTLVKQGKLPRARLLESNIEALERDFNHYRAKWFFECFDRLEPTDKELKKFAERILGLLGATAPNVASWALGRADAWAKSVGFNTQVMCHAMEPILRARAKGTAITALKMLERQAAACAKEAPTVAATIATALAHESPDVQKEAFRMLEKVSSPEDATVRAVVEKFQPTLAASVRSRVTKWLSQGTNSEAASSATVAVAQQVKSGNRSANKAATLPTISKQIESLYSIDVLKKNLKDRTLSIPAAIFDGTDIPRLRLVQKLTPIESIEELIDTCASVIEDGSLVNDLERCIDGLVRLCNSKPDDFDHMAAPLLKRIRKLIKNGVSPLCGVDPANDVIGLFYTFCTGKLIEPVLKSGKLQYEFEGEKSEEYSINFKKPIGFLSAHCLACARRIATGNACQLMSTPTHEGGWIDPLELAKRANAWTESAPDVRDVILAMLRLAPENRAAALKLLKDKPAEWSKAISYALGAEKVAIGKTPALWVAAARARSPWKDDPQIKKKHSGLGPDAAEAASVTIHFKSRKSGSYTFHDSGFAVQPAVPKSVDPMLVTVLMHASQSLAKEYSFEMGGFAGRTNGAVRWTAMVWPLARESYFAASADDCLDNIDWWEAQWQNRTMLEPLLDSGTPMRYAGILFLVGMLAAKEPGESGLATDIAIRAIEDGRIGSDNLGEALALLLPSGVIKPGRWLKTLGEVARASLVHAAVVQIALQHCFSNPAIELPKDSSKLLEMLYELSIELEIPVTHEPCRAWLASGVATGKSAKLAKSLLDLNNSPDAHPAIEKILEQTIERRTFAAKSMS